MAGVWPLDKKGEANAAPLAYPTGGCCHLRAKRAARPTLPVRSRQKDAAGFSSTVSMRLLQVVIWEPPELNRATTVEPVNMPVPTGRRGIGVTMVRGALAIALMVTIFLVNSP
jgi:hypothetical protein